MTHLPYLIALVDIPYSFRRRKSVKRMSDKKTVSQLFFARNSDCYASSRRARNVCSFFTARLLVINAS